MGEEGRQKFLDQGEQEKAEGAGRDEQERQNAKSSFATIETIVTHLMVTII